MYTDGRYIYLDHAATTPVAKPVRDSMEPYLQERPGNPSSLHELGREGRAGIEESRTTIAQYLGVETEEVIFTSCATEANNLAIKGTAYGRKGHYITTRIEHHAVLRVFEWLEKQEGYQVTYLEPDEEGLISPRKLESAIQDDTVLASVMYANNEIGTIQPIEQLSGICSRHGVLFHTDAVQAFGKFTLSTEEVDMLSASGHKIYGPKGVGCLYVREGMDLQPLLHGGGHERGLRSGTENVPGIVGMAAATELTQREADEEMERQRELRDKLIREVLRIPDTKLNGHPEKRLANNANFSFSYVEGESIVMKLDERGFATSTGSACSSPELEPSHVLLAIGLNPQAAHGSLRVSLGRDNTEKDVDAFLGALSEVIEELRAASPFKGSWSTD